MSEMVERVARAAYFAGEGISLKGAFAPSNDAHWAHWWKEDREVHEAMARAAIEAMREPTEAMAEAGAVETNSEEDAIECWTTMVDAALK